MEEKFSFREWLRQGEINEMAPVTFSGHAPFESLDGESKSKAAMKESFEEFGKINDMTIFNYKKEDRLIKVAKLYWDDLLNEQRWAIIAELSFKSEKIKSSNKLIDDKIAMRINTINVREASRRDKIASKLYGLLLSKNFIVVSDGTQYEGAVKLWKSFTKIPSINLYIWNEIEDKIISMMTAKTHDNVIWSNGDLGDYSKMSTKIILTLK